MYNRNRRTGYQVLLTRNRRGQRTTGQHSLINPFSSQQLLWPLGPVSLSVCLVFWCLFCFDLLSPSRSLLPDPGHLLLSLPWAPGAITCGQEHVRVHPPGSPILRKGQARIPGVGGPIALTSHPWGLLSGHSCSSAAAFIQTSCRLGAAPCSQGTSVLAFTPERRSPCPHFTDGQPSKADTHQWPSWLRRGPRQARTGHGRGDWQAACPWELTVCKMGTWAPPLRSKC